MSLFPVKVNYSRDFESSAASMLRKSKVFDREQQLTGNLLTVMKKFHF